VNRQRLADRVYSAGEINIRGAYAVYLMSGDLERAFDLTLRETTRNDSYIDWALLANVCFVMGKESQAVEAWRQATRMAPNLTLRSWRAGWEAIYHRQEIVDALSSGIARLCTESRNSY